MDSFPSIICSFSKYFPQALKTNAQIIMLTFIIMLYFGRIRRELIIIILTELRCFIRGG